MLLVVALELNGEFEHRLLQQSRFGAELIGRDRLLLGTEGRVQDCDVVVGSLGEAPPTMAGFSLAASRQSQLPKA